MNRPLAGKVAVVTGASRGVGKGVALSLGAAGATVYITGRSASGHPATVSLPGSVDETAQEATRSGGVGIAIRCDQRNDDETQALFERVEQEQGRLDVLVNSAWAGYEGLHDGYDFPMDQPFWQRRLSYWDDNLFGVRAAYVASVFAARIMTVQRGGLIAFVSNFIDDFGNPAYHVAKTATDRLAADMAHELRDYNVATVSLYPGLVRTEGILKYAEYIDLTHSESPLFTGRAVVALSLDPNIMAKSGRAFHVRDVAAEYGLTDTDSQPANSPGQPGR